MKKYLRFLPMIVWMGLIFYLSAQTATQSSGLSNPIAVGAAELISKLFHLPTDEASVLSLSLTMSFYVRKLAHITLYALLAVWTGLAFYRRRSFWKNAILLFSVSLLYACTDELHQLFVPGRSGEIRDVLIDGIGILAGTFAFLLVMHLVEKKNAK